MRLLFVIVFCSRWQFQCRVIVVHEGIGSILDLATSTTLNFDWRVHLLPIDIYRDNTSEQGIMKKQWSMRYRWFAYR